MAYFWVENKYITAYLSFIEKVGDFFEKWKTKLNGNNFFKYFLIFAFWTILAKNKYILTYLIRISIKIAQNKYTYWKKVSRRNPAIDKSEIILPDVPCDDTARISTPQPTPPCGFSLTLLPPLLGWWLLYEKFTTRVPRARSYYFDLLLIY